MRIRLGFVSNSSAANFFIVIKNINLNDILNEFITKAYENIDKKSVLEILNAELEELNAIYNSDKKSNISSALGDVWKNHFERIDVLKSKLLSISEEDRVEMLKLLLSYSNINYQQINEDVHIDYMTIMFNDFDSSMPSLLKEFIFFLNFYGKYKIEYTVEQQ